MLFHVSCLPIQTDFTEIQTSADRRNSEGLPSCSVHSIKISKTFKPHIFCAQAHITIFLGPGTTQPPSTGRLLLLHVSLPRELAMVGWFVPPSEPACFFIWGFSGRQTVNTYGSSHLCACGSRKRNTAYQGFIYREMPVFCRRMVGLRMGGGRQYMGPATTSGIEVATTASTAIQLPAPKRQLILTCYSVKGAVLLKKKKKRSCWEKYQCKKVFVQHALPEILISNCLLSMRNLLVHKYIRFSRDHIFYYVFMRKRNVIILAD